MKGKRNFLKLLGTLVMSVGLCLMLQSFPVLAQKYGGSIKIAIPHRIVQLDTHTATGIGSLNILKQIFEPLFTYDKDLKIVPCLASKLSERTEDGSYIITLRKGIRFHDGSELKANDVKFSFDRILNPKFGSLQRRVFNWIESVEVLDDYQVKFNLIIPLALDLFNEKMTGLMIMSEAATRRLGKEVKRYPIGTGPFKFVEWKEGDYLTLEKNENYWKPGLPYLDKLTYVTIEESSVRVINVLLGKFDVITEMPYDLIKMLKGNPNVTLSVTPSALYDMVSFYHGTVPFNNVKIRTAFRYALDTEKITKAVFGEYATPATYVMPPWHPMYDSNVPKCSQNIEKAKQLLAEAGYPNGLDFELMVGTLDHLVASATIIQSMLAKVGLRAKIRLGEVESLYSRVAAGKCQAFVAWGNTAGLFGPGADILLRWAEYKGSMWKDTEGILRISKLLDEALVTKDKEERKSIYSAIQRIELEDAPRCYLNYRDFIAAWNSKLKGIYPDVGTVISFAEAHFIE